MKRSIIFGLLCMLVTAVYYLSIFYILLLIGVSEYFYDMPHVATRFAYEELLYKIAESGQSMNIFYASIVIFLVVFAWLLIRLGFMTKQRLKFWRSLPAYMRNLPGGWRSFATRLAFVTATSYGYYWLAGSSYFLYEFDSMLPYMNSYGSNLGYLLFMAQLIFPELFLVFASGVFVHTVMTSRNITELKRGLAVTMTGVAVFAFSLTVSLAVHRHLDGHMSLSAIDGISSGAEPRVLIVMSETPYEISVDEGFKDFDSDPFGQDNAVNFSKSNERAIKDYLKRTGDLTVLRKAAYNYLIAKNMRELDPDAALPYYADGIKRTADVLYWSVVASRLSFGVVNTANKRLLGTISDESVLWIGGKSALRLSRAYGRYGEIEKARYWYDKGVMTGRKLGKDEFAKYVPTDEPPFVDGVISGILVLDSEVKKECGVGLIRKTYSKSLMEDYGGSGGFRLRISLPTNLLTGKSLRSGESFNFGGLPEDEYLIILSVPLVDGKKYRVLNSPGPIVVSEENPAVDIGTIELVLEDDEQGSL